MPNTSTETTQTVPVLPAPLDNHPLSYVDEDLRRAVLKAFDEYEQKKQTKQKMRKNQLSSTRYEDISRGRQLASGLYPTNAALIFTMVNFANSLRTGFNFFGVAALHVNTGRSELKKLILNALKTKSTQVLVDTEGRLLQERCERDLGQSREELLLENAGLRRQVMGLEASLGSLETTVQMLESRCRTLEEEKNKATAAYCTALADYESTSLENIHLKQQAVIFLRENQQFKRLQQEGQETKSAFSSLTSRSSSDETYSRHRLFFGNVPT